MTQVTIHLLPSSLMSQMYFSEYPADVSRTARESNQYIVTAPFTVDQTGEDAAEEVFDLTNNPSRQEERVRLYGRGRSVSVGDMVDVDGTLYLCSQVGWKVIR